MLTDKEIQDLKKKVPVYKSIFPPRVDNLYDNKLVKLLGEANRAIGNLNSSKKIIPNPDLLVGPVLLKEALASSKIEGTQTTIRDVVREEANIAFADQFEQGQAREVVNHIMTTRHALEKIDKISLSSRLLKEMHSILMHRTRGSHKTTGDFRVGNNAIEKDDQIIYIPPDPTLVPDLISNLEKYLNDPTQDDQYDPLLRAAIVHYQFEAIHPFADGNGRLGRVLISLQLIKEDVLRYPVLYLSGYLLREKKNYDKCLLEVTTEGKWKEWILFFLEGIKEQAIKSEEIVDKIFDLYTELNNKAKAAIKSTNIRDLVTLTFTKGAISANDAVDSLKISHTAALDLLRKLENLGLLKSNPNEKRNIHFTNDLLISLLEAFI